MRIFCVNDQHLYLVVLIQINLEVTLMLCSSDLHQKTLVFDWDVIETFGWMRVLSSQVVKLVAVLIDHRDYMIELGVVMIVQIKQIHLELLSVVTKSLVAEVNLDVVRHCELVLSPLLKHILS